MGLRPQRLRVTGDVDSVVTEPRIVPWAELGSQWERPRNRETTRNVRPSGLIQREDKVPVAASKVHCDGGGQGMCTDHWVSGERNRGWC